MILLDTNIVSETTRKSPHPSVVAWLDTQPERGLALPFSALVEIQKGISDLMLKNLQKARALQRWLDDLLASDINFLPMDTRTALILGRMYATPQLRDLWTASAYTSKPKMRQDLMIAATAIAYQIRLATRNTADFERINDLFPLPGIVNPFDCEWPGASKPEFVPPEQFRPSLMLN
ncbi:type II toxin-antitoxin system VapC family toxin [Aminobacter ciceronei]|uniref:PIN domain-containing protein n=1 Tax=Aminobacter ciceronei TaxID=150723 RepID=A0ABR6CHB5_9HYPH|nr:type II toxin-antitoxin system VapC family toxin [Aminobacter ciceronei]MBA8910540.1 hypothetical protein [Aminobacter ciceronei]MBA9024311.1 hypothetical protein [Aminobacter ciceronei]